MSASQNLSSSSFAVDYLGAVLNLLQRHFGGFLKVVFLDELGKTQGPGDVGAFPHIHKK